MNNKSNKPPNLNLTKNLLYLWTFKTPIIYSQFN
jgi:hypothetical protein